MEVGVCDTLLRIEGIPHSFKFGLRMNDVGEVYLPVRFICRGVVTSSRFLSKLLELRRLWLT